MQMTEEQKKEFRPFMADLWEYMKKYFNPGGMDDDFYWKSLIHDAGELGKKYNVQPRTIQANFINGFLAGLDGEEFPHYDKERTSPPPA